MLSIKPCFILRIRDAWGFARKGGVVSASAPSGALYKAAIGGRDSTAPRSGTVFSTVEVYDIATDTWTTSAPLNVPRSDLVAVEHGGKIYAIGGWNGAAQVGTMEVYDPTTNTWSIAASMPTARSNLVADVKGNIIYAIGGHSPLLNTTEAYDIAKGTWSTKVSMTTARSEMDSARVGDKIYVIGGGIFGALIGGNVNEAYIAG
jgi:N-acetylneuraminic acid mutarotase